MMVTPLLVKERALKTSLVVIYSLESTLLDIFKDLFSVMEKLTMVDVYTFHLKLL
jgi:hypothetical protein